MYCTGSNAERVNYNLEMEVRKKKAAADESFGISKGLLESSMLTDFKVTAGTRVFNASRLLLASKSEVFRRMLESNMKETMEGVMALDDDPNAVNAMLKHISNRYLIEDAEVARKVIELAHRYEIEGLKNHCEVVLSENLSLEDLRDRFNLAYDLELSLLLKKCFQFGFYRFNGFKEEIPNLRSLKISAYDAPKTVPISVKPSSITLRQKQMTSDFTITNRNMADSVACDISTDPRHVIVDKYAVIIPPNGSITITVTKKPVDFGKTSVVVMYKKDVMSEKSEGQVTVPIVNY